MLHYKDARSFGLYLQEGSRNVKAKRALAEMGAAVFNGGFSTFLAFVMLSTSRSYVYKTFFEVINTTPA